MRTRSSISRCSRCSPRSRFGFPEAPRRLIVERLSFLGAGIEVLQSIPVLHRDCDVFDWATDTVAVVIAVLLLARLLPRRSFAQDPV